MHNESWDTLGREGSIIQPVDPSNAGKDGSISRPHLKEPSNGTAMTRRCDAIGLQMRPSKDKAPELRHSQRGVYGGALLHDG